MTEYRYNQLDQVTEVWDSGKRLAAYTYNPDGTVRSIKNGNSLYTEYAYDADKNLTMLKSVLGEETIVENHYRYDGNGNRTEKQQLSGRTLYEYDSLNRLSRVEYPGWNEELFYDKAGNRTGRVAGGAEERYYYDKRNRQTAQEKNGVHTEYQYDAAGNLVRYDKAAYTYDAFNRNTRVETFDGNIQINRYDAEGLRHEMEENGKLVQLGISRSTAMTRKGCAMRWRRTENWYSLSSGEQRLWRRKRRRKRSVISVPMSFWHRMRNQRERTITMPAMRWEALPM